MLPSTAFTPPTPFATSRALPCPSKSRSRDIGQVPTCSSSISQPARHISFSQTRRAFMSTLGALMGLSASARLERVLALDSGIPLRKLQEARTRVDDIDTFIDAAKWDSVRTVLAGPSITAAKDACKVLIESSPSDLKGAFVGSKEDLLSAIRLLDTSVYSNVFIGEDRQILGTKVDYDTPRIYLLDLKTALDELIEIASS